MKSKKWHVGWLIICCLGLIACSDQKETKKVEAAPESTAAEVAGGGIPTTARTRGEKNEQTTREKIEGKIETKKEAGPKGRYVKYFQD